VDAPRPALVAPVIRHATAADLPAIVAIYNASIPGRLATADTSPVTVDSRREWFEAFDPALRPIWVAEAGGEIAAWLGMRSFYGRPAYHRTVEVAVYVAPRFQRQGLARALLARAVDSAPGMGIATLLAFVFGHNEPSLALFRRAGFAGWGNLPRVAELDGVERDLVILGRRLTP
jgi:L-amino acid N-acyltransferase YncA